jgi:hypothetical protein
MPATVLLTQGADLAGTTLSMEPNGFAWLKIE